MFFLIPLTLVVLTAVIVFAMARQRVGSIAGAIGLAFLGVVIWFAITQINMRMSWFQDWVRSGPDQPAIIASFVIATVGALLAMFLILRFFSSRA